MSANGPPDLFAAIPFRLYRAVEEEEVSKAQAILLVQLIYRCRRDGGRAAFKLSDLKRELLAWPWTTEKMRQDLRELHEHDWITAESPGPGKSTWKVRLNLANLQPASSPTLESTSNALNSDEAANPDADIPFGDLSSPTVGVLQEQSTATSDLALADEDIRKTARQSFGDDEYGHEVDRLLRHLKDVKPHSRAVLEPLARKLPPAVVASLRERAEQSGRKGVGWAVNALKQKIETGDPWA